MKYYSVIKRKNVQIHAWMKLENIMLKLNKKFTYCMKYPEEANP